MENYFQRFVENLEHGRVDDQAPPKNSIDSEGPPGAPVVLSGRVAARLAIYDSPRVAPRVVDLDSNDYREFIDLLATKTYQSSKEVGGNMPYTILREIIENLIHAYFKEVIISILDNGNTVRISDQGPGIRNKDKAFEPGFSTATAEMKTIIKGVGSGLPITKETLSFLGGAVSIEDNLSQGTVITVRVPGDQAQQQKGDITSGPTTQLPDLNKRQQQVLFLIMELGAVGPSKIATELGISLSTAYRDLIYLEEKSFIYSDEQGKRLLTSAGIEFLDDILNP